MSLTIVRKTKRPRRGVGKRAGLTGNDIVDVALMMSKTDPVSLARIARRLGVTPAAIGAHFDGGLDGLNAATSREALAGLLHSSSPRDWRADFRDLFASVAEVLRERPYLALWVGAHLSTDPILSRTWPSASWSHWIGLACRRSTSPWPSTL